MISLTVEGSIIKNCTILFALTLHELIYIYIYICLLRHIYQWFFENRFYLERTPCTLLNTSKDKNWTFKLYAY